jgi:hypothetical protein
LPLLSRNPYDLRTLVNGFRRYRDFPQVVPAGCKERSKIDRQGLLHKIQNDGIPKPPLASIKELAGINTTFTRKPDGRRASYKSNRIV